jgi:ParB family chromosome partitioning protein
VSDTAVESLKASIETVGLQNEIQVRKMPKTGTLRLMAGGHRMAAFRSLGRSEIPAKIWDCTNDFADLVEIDDNLAHASLDTLELAVFLAKRKEVYERAFPEAKQGGARGNQHMGGRQTDILSFCQSVAEKRDISERQVRRLVSAGSRLAPDEVRQLREGKQRVTLTDLQEIAKSDPSDRYAIVRELSEGTAKSAKEVLNRKKQPGAAISDPVEDALKKLQDAWVRAPQATRGRFVRDRAAELRDLLPVEPSEATSDGDVVDFTSARSERHG